MQKIISLFKRDYEGNRQVYNEVVEGAEWVIAGEGVATVKYDGTCCKIEDGKLYKRYDRKLTESANKRMKKDSSFVPTVENFKPPEGWVAAESEPNKHTGHWPGWCPVSNDDPQDQWHREAFDFFCEHWDANDCFTEANGTYELVGPKIGSNKGGNPYGLEQHFLWRHGVPVAPGMAEPPRDFEGLREYFSKHILEGIVWHHPDGRMVKIKRKDFGLEWPVTSL